MYWYIFLFFASGSAWDVARTPPLGFNTWNKFGCSVTGQILMDTARAMVDSGLAATGYVYVNSDDCWMLLNRTADGRQIANPDKFPLGFKYVADYIHSLGLKSGLYTAKGPTTCAGFAASCDHEIEDAAQWAEWGIDCASAARKRMLTSSCVHFARNFLSSPQIPLFHATADTISLLQTSRTTVRRSIPAPYRARKTSHEYTP